MTVTLDVGLARLKRMPVREDAWQLGLAAMPARVEEKNRRRVELKDATLAEALAPALESAGIARRVVDRLELVDEAMADMARHLGSARGEARLYSGPGVDAPRLRGFADAAAGAQMPSCWTRSGSRSRRRRRIPSSRSSFRKMSTAAPTP